MTARAWALSDDLTAPAVAAVIAVAVASTVWLLLELRRARETRGGA